MRKKLSAEMESFRQAGPADSGPFGYFLALCPVLGRRLKVLATDGRRVPGSEEEESWLRKYTTIDPAVIAEMYKWEHVSASSRAGVPTYAEMCWLKDQFWEDTETVLQLHVARSEHINAHPNCLHLWRMVPGTYTVWDYAHTDNAPGGVPMYDLILDSIPLPPHFLVCPRPEEVNTDTATVVPRGDGYTFVEKPDAPAG